MNQSKMRICSLDKNKLDLTDHLPNYLDRCWILGNEEKLLDELKLESNKLYSDTYNPSLLLRKFFQTIASKP